MPHKECLLLIVIRNSRIIFFQDLNIRRYEWWKNVTTGGYIKMITEM